MALSPPGKLEVAGAACYSGPAASICVGYVHRPRERVRLVARKGNLRPVGRPRRVLLVEIRQWERGRRPFRSLPSALAMKIVPSMLSFRRTKAILGAVGRPRRSLDGEHVLGPTG